MIKRTVPITLLTGYLGSGKTTLINHILTNQDKYKIIIKDELEGNMKDIIELIPRIKLMIRLLR